jgi:hypothetical protein
MGGRAIDRVLALAELRALPLKPPPSPLEVRAREVLLTVEEVPECVGALDTPMAEHERAKREREARWAALIAGIVESASVSDLARHPAGLRRRSNPLRVRLQLRS